MEMNAMPSTSSASPELHSHEGGAMNDEMRMKMLEERIESDKASLLMLKEKMGQQQTDPKKQLELRELARRRKARRLHNKIINSMVKLVQEDLAQGYSFGIVPNHGKSIVASSENLREWWKEKVKFHENAPRAIDKYRKRNSIHVPSSSNKTEFSILGALKELTDTILGSAISALMQHCYPPQRRFPIEKGVPPPWWPSMTEEWWPRLGFPADQTPPPYKKPHDLKKGCKITVLITMIMHIFPDTQKIQELVSKSKSLQDRMSMRETMLFSSVLRRVSRLYRPMQSSAIPDDDADADDDDADDDDGSGSKAGQYDVEADDEVSNDDMMNFGAVGGNSFRFNAFSGMQEGIQASAPLDNNQWMQYAQHGTGSDQPQLLNHDWRHAQQNTWPNCNVMAQNPQVMGLAHENPQIFGVVQNPQIIGLAQDPQVMGLAQNPQVIGFAQNPQIIGFAQNPQIFGLDQNHQVIGLSQAQNPEVIGLVQNPQVTGFTQNPQATGLNPLVSDFGAVNPSGFGNPNDGQGSMGGMMRFSNHDTNYQGNNLVAQQDLPIVNNDMNVAQPILTSNPDIYQPIEMQRSNFGQGIESNNQMTQANNLDQPQMYLDENISFEPRFETQSNGANLDLDYASMINLSAMEDINAFPQIVEEQTQMQESYPWPTNFDC